MNEPPREFLDTQLVLGFALLFASMSLELVKRHKGTRQLVAEQWMYVVIDGIGKSSCCSSANMFLLSVPEWRILVYTTVYQQFILV